MLPIKLQLALALQNKLAAAGRNGDSALGHLTPGELILPRELQSREVMERLSKEAQRKGINLPRYQVGSQANSINPLTGMREFWGADIVTGKQIGRAHV